jgi:hypothetical protein
LKYVDRCLFIRKQSVAYRFTQDLVPIFGGAWQIQRAVAKILDDVQDDVRDDIYFQGALFHIHGRLENRQMAVNCELHQRSLANSKDNTEFSDKVWTKIIEISF